MERLLLVREGGTYSSMAGGHGGMRLDQTETRGSWTADFASQPLGMVNWGWETGKTEIRRWSGGPKSWREGGVSKS